MSAVTHFGLGAALIAFLAGLASFFSPCVAPLVPGYIGYLASASLRAPTTPAGAPLAAVALDASGSAAALRPSGGRFARLAARAPAAPATLLFVAGFSAAFIALGLVSATFGSLLAAYRPALETLTGAVMLLMGAFLLGLLPRDLTNMLSREWRAHLPLRPAGHASRLSAIRPLAPFALGVVFAAGWTPCIGPVLASILLYAGATADRSQALALLACYSLGFALPFLGVGFGWAASLRALGWMRRHTRLISLVTGVALLVVGVAYLTGQATTFAIWAQRVTPQFIR